MNSIAGRARDVAAAVGIGAVAAIVQSVRLPAVLDGATLGVALGKATDPHLLTGFLDRAVVESCRMAAPCVQHANALVFAAAVAVAAFLVARRPFGLVAVAIAAISPLAVAAITDPLGASASVGLLLAALAAFATVGPRTPHVALRGALAIGLALADPTLVPYALAYGAFAGIIPLACAVAGTAIRIFAVPLAIDPLAGPATLVAFGACLFVGGPLLMLAVRYGAFRSLEESGRIALRGAALAAAALAGGLFAASGDVAVSWLVAEIALIAGIVCSVRTPRAGASSERAGIAAGALLIVQFVLFLHAHRDVTTSAIAYRGDDLRGMIAGAPARTCVAADATARRYVLASGDFLALYPPPREPAIQDDPAGCLGEPVSTTIVTMAGLAVNDWGLAVPLMQAYRDASDPSGVLQIEGGTVSPRTKVATPTGRGAFGNDIDTPLGVVGDFTVLTGFTYAPSCLRVGDGARLRFSAASVPGSPAIPLTIVARNGAATKTLLSTIFPASPANKPYRWLRYALPVPPADCTTFAFALKGAANGRTWLTFAGASVR